MLLEGKQFSRYCSLTHFLPNTKESGPKIIPILTLYITRSIYEGSPKMV